MTTLAPTDLTETATAVAVAVAAIVPSGSELQPGAPSRESDAVDSNGQAVLVPFVGARTGEFAIFADADLCAALADTELGALDLAQALAPALQAAAAALGDVALGQAETVDARLALRRILAHADALVVPLVAGEDIPAAVAIGVEAVVPGSAAPSAEDVPVHRLEMLRGVEMDVLAELGRTRLTVNELLALRAGAIIELDRSAGSPADLLVNGHLIARGEVVVVDENYALRITHIVSDESGR